MSGESVLRKASDIKLHELMGVWSARLGWAETEDERQLCRRMIAKYQGEIERRQTNGRSGEGD